MKNQPDSISSLAQQYAPYAVIGALLGVTAFPQTFDFLELREQREQIEAEKKQFRSQLMLTGYFLPIYSDSSKRIFRKALIDEYKLGEFPLLAGIYSGNFELLPEATGSSSALSHDFKIRCVYHSLKGDIPFTLDLAQQQIVIEAEGTDKALVPFSQVSAPLSRSNTPDPIVNGQGYPSLNPTEAPSEE